MSSRLYGEAVLVQMQPACARLQQCIMGCGGPTLDGALNSCHIWRWRPVTPTELPAAADQNVTNMSSCQQRLYGPSSPLHHLVIKSVHLLRTYERHKRCFLRSFRCLGDVLLRCAEMEKPGFIHPFILHLYSLLHKI